MTHLAQFLDALAPLGGCLDVQKMEEVDVRVLSFGFKGGVWAENSCRIPSPDARNHGCLTLLDVVSSYILVAPRFLGGFFQQIITRCDWKNDILF